MKGFVMGSKAINPRPRATPWGHLWATHKLQGASPPMCCSIYTEIKRMAAAMDMKPAALRGNKR